MDWKLRYRQAHQDNFKKEYPSAWMDGHYIEPKYPTVDKSNGLTTMICNFLCWSGHHGERTNTMGRPVAKTAPRFNIGTGQMFQKEIGIEWQKGSGTKGSSDIKGHINSGRHKFPIPVYIEVKIKRDTQSDAQIDYEKKVTSSGALYVIIKSPGQFFSFFDYAMGI